MKTVDKAFTITFATIGLIALACALFAGAAWHFYTSGLCALMVLAGIAGIKKSKNHERTNKRTDTGIVS